MDLDPNLTISDVLVLENLLDDIKAQRSEGQGKYTFPILP